MSSPRALRCALAMVCIAMPSFSALSVLTGLSDRVVRFGGTLPLALGGALPEQSHPSSGVLPMKASAERAEARKSQGARQR